MPRALRDDGSADDDPTATSDFTQDAEPTTASSTPVPSPSGLQGTRQADGSVVFTWDNPEPQEGDRYLWGVLQATGEPDLALIDTADGDGPRRPGDDAAGLHRGRDRARGPPRVGRARAGVRVMSWGSVRSRATTAAAVVTVPVLVLVLALLDQGFPLARLDLNDGGVWLTATSKLQLGRYNAQVEELNGGLSAAGSTFDVLQDEGDVLLVEPGQIAVVDPASVTLTTQVAMPGAEVSMAAGVVAVVDPDGNVVGPADRRPGHAADRDGHPRRRAREGWHAAVVARSGAVLAVAAEDGAVTRVDVVDGLRAARRSGTLGAGPVDRLTAVGDAPVDAVRQHRPDPGRRGGAPGRRTWRCSSRDRQSSRVLVASRTALLEVPLDGGVRGGAPDRRARACPPNRCRCGRCAHGAWASAVGLVRAAVRRRRRRGQQPRGDVQRRRARRSG